MKTFVKRVDKHLINGLRPESKFRRNAEYLAECKFCKPRYYGVRSSFDVTNPFSSNPFDSWPFPQIVRGREVSLLLGESEVRYIDESTWPWTYGSAVDLYDFYNQTNNKTITPGGPWHMADFGDAWLLTNGECNVIKTNQYVFSGVSDKVFVQDATPIQTICAHRGRAIFGGFDSSSSWPSAWDTLMNAWLTDSPLTTYGAFEELRENFVWWTSIGGGDLLMLFDPNGDYVSAEIDYMEILRRNETGFMPMDSQGAVLRVLPFGDSVMVYTEDAVYRMYLVDSPYPTYGLFCVASIGIAGRSAANGDQFEHVFVGVDGNLWKVSKEEGVRRLGYAEFLTDMVGQEIVVSFDPNERHFYISGEDNGGDIVSYVLTESGLGHCKQQITGAVYTPSGLVGVYDSSVGSIAYITTEAIDFNYRELKAIVGVEVGGFADTDELIHVCVDWRMNKDDSWTRSDWVLVNDQGFAHMQITAEEFRVLVKFSNYDNMELDYINIHWQPLGRRFVRGIDVS